MQNIAYLFGQGTEAQMRAALHAHILVWFLQRGEIEDYAPLAAIPREAVGTQPCQRPRNQKVSPLAVYQEDNCYHRVQMGRVMTEMVRPSTFGEGHGGFNDYAKLRMAGLARAIQTKLYLHSCSKKYCLQNRSTCRFFFPWPQQPQQQYCCNTERVAGQRRLESDDAWLNPHELYLAMFSPATVHCLPFDPRLGEAAEGNMTKGPSWRAGRLPLHTHTLLFGLESFHELNN